jgi:hypothetical protein
MTEDTKGKCPIIKVFRRCLGDDSKLEFRESVRSAHFGEALCEGEDNGLNSPDARRKVMRIDKKLHAKFPPINRSLTNLSGEPFDRRR